MALVSGLMIERRIGVIKERDADLLDHLISTLHWQKGTALLHRIDTAGDRPVVMEAEKIRALLPGRERVILQQENVADLFFQPDLRQFRKAFEQIPADDFRRAAAAVHDHEVVPEHHLHVRIDDKDADLQPVHDEIEQAGGCCSAHQRDSRKRATATVRLRISSSGIRITR